MVVGNRGPNPAWSADDLAEAPALAAVGVTEYHGGGDGPTTAIGLHIA